MHPRIWSLPVPAVTFLLCFAAYVTGLVPGAYWLDSSELAAAAVSLGIAHPPGHPLALLLGKLLSLLPLGSLGFRVALSQALAGAGAAALVTAIGNVMGQRVLRAQHGRAAIAVDIDLSAKVDPGTDEVAPRLVAYAALSVGIAFGFGYALAFQAVRPEVYALHTLLVLGSAYALVQATDAADQGPPNPRHVVYAAFCAALALANHTLLAGLYAVCALSLVLSRLPGRSLGARVRAIAWCGFAVVLGLLLYSYLPVRALDHPLVDWGTPTTAQRVWWTISARAFQKSLGHASLGDALDAWVVVAHELGLLVMPLAILGAAFTVRLQATRRLGLFLLAAAVLGVTAPALVGFDADNPDAYGYLAASLGMLTALAATVPALLWEEIVAREPALRRFSYRAMSLGLAVIVGVGVAELPRWARGGFTDPQRYLTALLEQAPPRSILISSYFQTIFGLWYGQVIEGWRPDVTIIHRHFLAYPGYREELLRRYPDLAPVLGDRDLQLDLLLKLRRERPVLLEYDVDVPNAFLPHLMPLGLLDELVPEVIARDVLLGVTAAADEQRARLAAALDDSEPQTRRLLLWTHYLAALQDCRLEMYPSATQSVRRARRWLQAPDPELEDLAKRCGLPAH